MSAEGSQAEFDGARIQPLFGGWGYKGALRIHGMDHWAFADSTESLGCLKDIPQGSDVGDGSPTGVDSIIIHYCSAFLHWRLNGDELFRPWFFGFAEPPLQPDEVVQLLYRTTVEAPAYVDIHNALDSAVDFEHNLYESQLGKDMDYDLELKFGHGSDGEIGEWLNMSGYPDGLRLHWKQPGARIDFAIHNWWLTPGGDSMLRFDAIQVARSEFKFEENEKVPENPVWLTVQVWLEDDDGQPYHHGNILLVPVLSPDRFETDGWELGFLSTVAVDFATLNPPLDKERRLVKLRFWFLSQEGDIWLAHPRLATLDA